MDFRPRGATNMAWPSGISPGAFSFGGPLVQIGVTPGDTESCDRCRLFNEAQTRAILCGFLDIHRRMTELEALLIPGTKPTPFSGYVNDLSPTEAKVVQDYFARIRTAMLAHLRESEIALDVRTTSLRWAIDVGISFIGINVCRAGSE